MDHHLAPTAYVLSLPPVPRKGDFSECTSQPKDAALQVSSLLGGVTLL